MFNKETYLERRKTLGDNVPSGLILLLGNIENPINFEHNTYPFRQDSHFLYYIGVNSPALAAIIDVEAGQTILFGNELSLDDIVWMGQQRTLADKAAAAGVSLVRPFSTLRDAINKALSLQRTVHYLPPYQSHNKLLLETIFDVPYRQLTPSVPLIKAIAAQRSVKTAAEIAEIETAIDVAVDMHRLAIRQTNPGRYEYEIANAMQHFAQDNKTSFSYPPIVTKHGEILHNHMQYNRLEDGDILLNDAGVETALGYCADLTRSYPVGNTFNALQEEMYEIVLSAVKVAEQALSPGIAFKDIHLKACTALAEGLIQIGFMKGNAADAVANNAHALFFQCGLGHMLGLDVHDMEDLGEQYVGYTDQDPKDTNTFGLKSLRLGKKLEPGYVLTVEPGIYIIPELIQIWHQSRQQADFINYDTLFKHIGFGGIRIEDNYVIEAHGYKRLGKYLERELHELYSLKNV